MGRATDHLLYSLFKDAYIVNCFGRQSKCLSPEQKQVWLLVSIKDLGSLPSGSYSYNAPHSTCTCHLTLFGSHLGNWVLKKPHKHETSTVARSKKPFFVSDRGSCVLCQCPRNCGRPTCKFGSRVISQTLHSS